MEKNRVDFDETFFNLGDIPVDKDVEIVVNCERGKELLHYTYPLDGCNCLSGVIEDDKIRILVRPYTRYGNVPKGEVKNFSGYLVVKLDPEYPEYVAKEDGRRIKSPNFRATRIHVVARVIGQ